jgi:hypothetical protein
MADPRYDIDAVPEQFRKYLKRFGNEFEKFVGVNLAGEDVDLRTFYLFLYGGLWSNRNKERPKRLNIEGIQALVNLRRICVESCYVDQQRAFLDLPSVEHMEFFQVGNFSGYLPHSTRVAIVRHSALASQRLWGDLNDLEHLNYYGSNKRCLLSELSLPSLKTIELYGTPIHTKVSPGLTVERTIRIFRGNWTPARRDIEEQIARLKDRGVIVTFKRENNLS